MVVNSVSDRKNCMILKDLLRCVFFGGGGGGGGGGKGGVGRGVREGVLATHPFCI